MMRRIAWTILILVLLAPVSALAEDKLSAAIGSASVVTGIASTSTSDKPKEVGISASEVLPGTGSRAGYVLGHNNVIPDSEWVFIGAKRAKKNVDYTIDYASGNIYFMEPVRSRDSVRVDYSYSKDASSARSLTGPGVMPFSFGDALKLNLTYSYRTSAVNSGVSGPDILTYGFNTSTKFGAFSNINSMAFISSPQSNSRLSLTGGKPGPTAVQPPVKKDHMLVQNADLGMGKFRLKLGYQDVGENFSGFQSMRESNASAANVINQLEKEKGIKRMDIAGQMPVGMDNGVFNFMMGRITDKNDDIFNRMFGFSNNSFSFNYNSREIGKSFSRFNDLKEADRAQYAAERGMTHNEMSMQFRTGVTSDNKPVWSGMSITELKDASGESLVDRSISVDVGKVEVNADMRSASVGFNRMGALTDEQKKRMALLARRSFNPKAQVAEVTDKDKAQIAGEAGLNRNTAIIDFPVGGSESFGFVSFSGISSANGGLNRSALGFKGKWFQLDFDHRSIDPTFQRFASLQPIEQASYGNEYGMTRTTLQGAFKFAGNDTNIMHTNVVDEKGASLSRDSFFIKNKLVTFSANLQNIAPDFNRILDLSDADRKNMLLDKGFRRADYAINLRPMNGLTIDSFVFNSDNVTAGQTRGQSRHKISYALPKGGPTVNLFQDSYDYVSDQGVIANYFHREVKFDNTFNLLGGLKFNTRSDFNVNQEADAQPVVSTISETHFESNQNTKTSFKLDMLNVDYGNGQFSDNKSVSIKTQAINRLALVGMYGLTARDANKSEVNGGFGLEWTIRKGDPNTGLKLNLSMANRDGGPAGSQQAQKFGLNGLLTKRFLMFNNVMVGSAVNTTNLKGRQTTCDNAIRVQAGIYGGSILFDNSDKLNPTNGIYYGSKLLQYDTDKSDKKWYHFSYMKQELVAPSGKLAEKRNLAFDMKLSKVSSFTVKSYYGKDDKNGEVLPVGGTTINYNHTLKNGVALTAGYSTDVNDLTNRMARIIGCGVSGKLRTGATYQFYYGWSRLVDCGKVEHENVFKMSYDHKLDAEHFITFTAEKKSDVDKTSINPFEGNMVARIDYRTTFN